MASERDEALSSVVADQSDQPDKLNAALSEAEQTKQLALTNDHAIKMRRAELGWFGRVFGGEAHASIVVAFVVIILAFSAAIGLWFVAYKNAHPEFWSSEAHIALATATTALGYVFGRGSKEPQK